MSQFSLTQPSDSFDLERDFPFENQFLSGSSTFTLPRSRPEKKKKAEAGVRQLSFESQPEVKKSKPSSPYQVSAPVFNVFPNVPTNFLANFPKAQNYMSKESILRAFPHLETINNLMFDVNSISNNAHFFIVRSSNDDNVHKAIKYRIWSTTASGKATLSNAWRESEKQGVVPEIYLIFSVVNSNHVLGVANMASDVKDNETFMYWWEPMKWFGTFQLKWLFVKDVHCSRFEHIKEEAFGTSSFINLKDCTKLNFDNGREVLRIIRDCQAKSDIFGSFEYMDDREDYIRAQRDNNIQFLNYFQECCTAYQKDPAGYSPQKKFQNNKKGNRPNGNSFGGRKQRNGYYQKNSFTGNEQSPPSNNNNNKKGQQNYTNDDFPPISLVEQYGIKTSIKKNKNQKSRSNDKKKDEKINDIKEENSKVNN